MNEFAKNLKRLRAALGITQEELEFRSGVNKSTIGGYEIKDGKPTLKNALKLCKGLGCDMNTLTEGVEL